jgi:hypothetical protein
MLRLMQAPETVKLEVEVPKDQVQRILASSTESSSATDDLDKEIDKEARIAKFKKQLAETKGQVQAANTENIEIPKSQDGKPNGSILPSTSDTTPPNSNQKKIIFTGLAIALAGLILWPLSNFVISIVIAIIGAAIITTGTFAKV